MDMLEFVVARLLAGNMREIAVQTGIPLMSLYRIRNGEIDPPYSRVALLYAHFRKASKR
jgi:hypothetical protein